MVQDLSVLVQTDGSGLDVGGRHVLVNPKSHAHTHTHPYEGGNMGEH